MARAKKTTIQFSLDEEDHSLQAVLKVNGTRLVDVDVQQVPTVIVRHPKAQEDELLDHATYWARRSPKTWSDPATWLDDYIASREEKLMNRIADIRRLLRAMEAHARNANVAKLAQSRLRK